MFPTPVAPEEPKNKTVRRSDRVANVGSLLRDVRKKLLRLGGTR